MSFEIVWNFIMEKPGISLAIAAGVGFVIVGLVNYIKALKSVKAGEESDEETSPAPGKPVKPKTKRVLPVPVLIAGIVLSFIPFLARLADLNFGFKLSEFFALDVFWIGISAEEMENDFEMLINLINSAIVTILLFITFCRACRKKRWGVLKIILVYFLTYNLAISILYMCCITLGEAYFLSFPGGGLMIYTWIVYLYIAVWVLIDKIKDKNAISV